MKSTVTRRGQTVVPAELRRRYGVEAGTALEWIDTGHGICVVPLPADIIGALRGQQQRRKTRREVAPSARERPAA